MRIRLILLMLLGVGLMAGLTGCGKDKGNLADGVNPADGGAPVEQMASPRLLGNAPTPWNGADAGPHFVGISDDNIVWSSIDGHHVSVFLYDGATVTQLPDSGGAFFSDVSGSNVTWMGDPEMTDYPTELNIFLYDGEKTIQLSDDEHEPGSYPPRISGSRVVWASGEYGDEEIFLYDGERVLQLTDNNIPDQRPEISDSLVAWTAHSGTHEGGEDMEIFIYDGQKVIQLTDNDSNDGWPQVSGGNIVWVGDYGTIFLYDGSTITQLTDNGDHPQISGSNIVWQGFDGNDDEIFFYDGETVTQLTDNDVQDEYPHVSGRNVAWLGRGDRSAEIFFYDGETITQVTDNDYRDIAPQISGSTVVWQTENGDIYTWTAPAGK